MHPSRKGTIKPVLEVGKKDDKPMKKNTLSELRSRVEDKSRSAIDEQLLKGARRMLQSAIESEMTCSSITNQRDM